MTNLMATFYLLFQATGGGDQGTVKPADSDGSSHKVESFRQEDLDALLRKVDLLESEVKELKKTPSGPEKKTGPQPAGSLWAD